MRQSYAVNAGIVLFLSLPFFYTVRDVKMKSNCKQAEKSGLSHENRLSIDKSDAKKPLITTENKPSINESEEKQLLITKENLPNQIKEQELALA